MDEYKQPKNKSNFAKYLNIVFCILIWGIGVFTVFITEYKDRGIFMIVSSTLILNLTLRIEEILNNKN